ncbi:Mis6-domain-containing protein [Immersiella caudata]|uniref:Mis6-domain-containing protein n=1 Tax=Immersiella caudata TaxID=314043 RepID=A0AA40C7H8_9PEZI|nr:Mis6-domain-containing protein [Immersiella caudata]
MTPHEDGSRDLGVLLDDIEAASKLTAKRRELSIKSTVDNAASALFERGALPDELARIVELLTVRNRLDQSSLGSLVRNLYPARKVSDDVVLRVVGALGHGQHKPSLALQSLLVRWLVMVYHLLEKTGILSQTYGVLFNLLDTAAIRPQLCHLLALVTRRKHVRPFRIQAILGLSRQTGSDPALVGLLRVFKNYYPEIIVGESTKGRAAAFKHPDPQWRERLEEIRRQHTERYDDGVRNGFAVNHALARQMKGAKLTGLPSVRTQHAQEDSITLEEIDNPEFFAQNLEKIELPTQLVAILADPLLQKLMLLRPDAEGFSRISNWLTSSMSEIASGDADPSTFLDLVEIIHEYTASTKNFPPLLVGFFRAFFQLYKQLLRPLEHSLLDNTSESQVALLNFYTRLLRRWTVAIREKVDFDALPKDSVPDLINHVNGLALTLTQTSPSVPTYLVILDFYSSCASLFSQRPILLHVEITIPPALLIYILFFSGSLPTISRLGGVLAAYKRSWEAVMTPPAMRALTERERKQINTFNGFLMDLCNCIWRGRAFGTSDLNAQGCRIPRSLPPVLESYLHSVDSDLALAAAFGLSHSPVLCMQSIAHVRELEDEVDEIRARHAGPVTQASLGQLANRGGLQLAWQEYRVGVLQHLEEKGFEGVSELMYNTMKNLAKTKQ